MSAPRPMSLLARSAAMAALSLWALAAASFAYGQAARVVSVQGTAVTERAGQPPRVLAVGDGVEQSDVVNVAQKSHVMLEFRDKSRVTLRPNTVFRVDSYVDSGPKQSMVLGLVKGGLRANTGAIAKGDPNAVRVQTETVILGVRGTDFDARICAGDCAAENEARAAVQARAQALAVGRVIEMSGTLAAVRPRTPPRELQPGAPIHAGDALVTGPGSHAVVAFLDGSRVSLGEAAHLAVQRYAYDARAAHKGEAHLKLVSGKAHVWTGELAKSAPEAFLFETTAGMIRTRGAGFSVGGVAGVVPRASGVASGPRLAMSESAAVSDAGGGIVIAQGAAGDALVFHTWDGTIILQTATERIELKTTDTLAVAIVGGRITVLPAPPAALIDRNLPRPDSVNIDPSTFGDPGQDVAPGLYVWVREGLVVLGQGKEAFEIKAGNAALATGAKLALLDTVPNFMRFDPTPRFPGGAHTGNVPRAFRSSDGSVSNTCQ